MGAKRKLGSIRQLSYCTIKNLCTKILCLIFKME